MLFRQNKWSVLSGKCLVKMFVFIAFLSLIVSCSFIDLRQIGISTVPDMPWALLPDADSAVIIRFDTEMEKSSVENIFHISSPMGLVEGKLQWEDNDMYFIPDSPWLPGVRYSLRLSGTVTAGDGRELPVSKEIPFFAVSHSIRPYLVSFSPDNNASTGVWDFPVLSLNFSKPMDRLSTQEAVKLDIPGERIFEWLDDDKTVLLTTNKALNPWTVYSWTVSEKALSKEGAPLAREYTGRFITDIDRDFITVLRVIPLMPSLTHNDGGGQGNSAGSDVWGDWTPAGMDLSQGIGSGHCIGVEFSKIPEGESLRRAFSFVPSLPGRVEILSPNWAVFIPSRDPEPEIVYSLRISGNLRDVDGLRMGDDYAVTFVPDIPFLEVISVSSVSGTGSPQSSVPYVDLIAPDSGDVIQTQINSGGIVRIILNFSLPFDSANHLAKEESALKITLRSFFPGSLPPVSLRTALWLSSDKLFLEWEGLTEGSDSEPHFYRLTIPGGSAGIFNGKGSYLREDLIIFLEVIK